MRARRRSATPRVRCIRRIGRRGLAGACIEGMLASSAPYVAVIDADLQHDETLLPRHAGAAAKPASADLVVASRYIDGGEHRRARGGPARASAGWSSALARRLLGARA